MALSFRPDLVNFSVCNRGEADTMAYSARQHVNAETSACARFGDGYDNDGVGCPLRGGETFVHIRQRPRPMGVASRELCNIKPGSTQEAISLAVQMAASGAATPLIPSDYTHTLIESVPGLGKLKFTL